MTIKRVSSGPGLPPGFPFSLASEANGILFISGMPALDAAGKFAPGTFEEEADRAWANIADIGNYGDINNWWRKRFPDPARAPARLTFQAGALPFGAKIEFQAVAARSVTG